MSASPLPVAEGSGADLAGLDLGQGVVAEVRNVLAKARHKIEHCLGQLNDADVLWRPRPEMNSVAIVIRHLCGNLRQWIMSGLGGLPDHRNRPAEFLDPGPVTVALLLHELRSTLEEADAVLAGLDAADLLRVRRVQGFDVSGMHVLWDTISHFVGHTHQIVQWTRLIRGENYRFDFVPAGKGQGA